MPPTPIDIKLEALPSAAREIAEIIGIDGILKLASAAKNRHVYVPKTLTAECRIVEQVGWVIAQKLHKHYAGELLNVPTCWFAALSPDGIEAMREARKQGIQPRLLAKITGLSESGIRVALQRGGWVQVAPSIKSPKYFTNVKKPPPGMGPFDGGGVRMEHCHKPSVVTEK